MIGGALLLNSFRSMFGGQHHSLMDGGGGRSPWGGDGNLAGSDMARDAGVNDIGRNDRLASNDSGQDRAGFFDTANADFDSSDDDGDADFGFDDSDSDTA